MALYTDDSTGFTFEYDPDIWTIMAQDDGFVVLGALGGDVAYIVDAAPADRVSVDALFEARRDLSRQQFLGFGRDDDPKRALLGTAILGHRPGRGGLFGGTLDTPQGPSADYAIAIVGATDGRITATTAILVPADIRDAGLQVADTMNNSFMWPADPVVQ
jgi:hypothetical protein